MKEIKDFPEYLITEDGKIYSTKYNKLRELKPGYHGGYRGGYYVIILCNNGKRITKQIHRLVAETYITNPDNLPQVNHIDENKLNNHVSNLEWVTNHQNAIHSKCRWIYEVENIITGEIQETINLNEFSKDNNLDHSSLRRTLTGRIQKQHKNFRIISKTQFK
jgi:hypothetical protein